MEIEFEKKNGKVVYFSKSLRGVIDLLRNGKYTISIKRKTKPRTVNQNALMWMWFACMASETGQDKSDIHDYYCSKFLQRTREINGKVVTIVGHTSELNSTQFKEFLERIQADALVELGISLPDPGDQYFGDFENEYK